MKIEDYENFKELTEMIKKFKLKNLQLNYCKSSEGDTNQEFMFSFKRVTG